MRSAVALLACAIVCAASAAAAETRTFILANQPDGYGVDRCLADGHKCGVPVARAYCQSHDYSQAASFRKIDRDEVTGTIPVSSCSGAGCDDLVAITCQR